MAPCLHYDGAGGVTCSSIAAEHGSAALMFSAPFLPEAPVLFRC